MLKTSADGKIEDTGPLNTARMPTVDEEFLGGAKDFIGRQVRANRPFFVWFNSTRMHVFTHLKPSSLGKTGKGMHADGMVEHDGMVGELLQQLDDLGIADNTIVLYTTDNGAELALWPDGAQTPFHGEKGTTWEGGMRIPMMVRWPGVVKPGTQYNEIISLIDWFPTLCAAAGIPDIKEKMKTGFAGAGGKSFRVHLDGYNFMPFFKGETTTPPRDALYYFDQGGNLNAIRWNDWKLSFATASRKYRDRDPRNSRMVADREPAHGSLRARHGGRRRSDRLPGPKHVADRAGAGEDQGVLLRLRPVPLSGRQLAERERHQLRPASAAGGLEAAQRARTHEAAIAGAMEEREMQ